MNSTPAVTEGDRDEQFGFATLGSFRKTRGPQRLSAYSVSRYAGGPTEGWTRPVRAAGNTSRSGLTNEGRVLSDTEPVELLRLSFLRLWPLP